MRAATLNGLAVADVVVVPIESSLLGLGQLLQVIAAVPEAHQPNMIIRALTTMFNRRQNLDKQVRQQVETSFGPELVLETRIRKSVSVAEAAVEYSPAMSGAFDFTKLTQELLEDTTHDQEASRSTLSQYS